MTREEMLDEVIRVRGFEDRWTIWFAELMESETISDSALQSAMVAAVVMPFDDEDEDEQSSSLLRVEYQRPGDLDCTQSKIFYKNYLTKSYK